MLRNCLQAAAARIYDESADVNRATKRIEILLKWLPDDGSQETGFKIDLFIQLREVITVAVYSTLDQCWVEFRHV